MQNPLPTVTGNAAFAIAAHMPYTCLLRRLAAAIIFIGLTSRLWTQSCKKP